MIYYSVLFLAMAFLGEEAMLIAGALSRLGYLDIWITVPVALAGVYLGDFFWFWIGRKFALSFIKKFGRFFFFSEEKFKRVSLIFEKRGKTILFFSKFMYGINHMMIMAAGISGMPKKEYIKCQLPASLVWTLFFSFLGYAFSSVASWIIKDAKGLAIGVAVLIVLVFVGEEFVGRWWAKKIKSSED